MIPPEAPHIVGPASVGPGDRRWEKKAEDLEFKALENVRSAAEKWGASLAAILALTGTVLVVKGRESVTELSSGAQLGIGLILGVAFIVAVSATMLAALAAQGTPKDLHWPSGPRLRQWERAAALTAKQRLRWSRMLTLLSVLLIAGGVALLWYGPEAEGSGSTVLLAPERGMPLCGSLVQGTSGLELKVGETSSRLPPGPYSSIVAVENCPPKEEGK